MVFRNAEYHFQSVDVFWKKQLFTGSRFLLCVLGTTEGKIIFLWVNFSEKRSCGCAASYRSPEDLKEQKWGLGRVVGGLR